MMQLDGEYQPLINAIAHCLRLLSLFTPAFIVYTCFHCLRILSLFTPALIVYACFHCLRILTLFTPALIVLTLTILC